MHLKTLLAGAALFASAYAKSVDSFAQGGNLPDENILFGPMKRQAKSPSRIMKRQSSVAPSTSTALPNPADPACTNAPDSRYDRASVMFVFFANPLLGTVGRQSTMSTQILIRSGLLLESLDTYVKYTLYSTKGVVC